MNSLRMKRYLAATLVASLLVFAGCQKKITKVAPLEPAKPAAQEIIAQPAPDTPSFKEANLNGELLQQAKEALQNIYFDFNKATVLSASETRLRIIGKFMVDHPVLKVLITGNCDERGSSEYNIGLGEKRANASKRFLVAYGVAGDRLEVTSYGKERLAVTGCTEESCHAKNRRDEFIVLQENGQPLSSAR